MKGYGLAVSPHQDGEFSSGRDGGDVLSATGAPALEEGQSDEIFGRDNSGWRATRVGPDVLLIDFRLDQPREIAQRLLPAEVTGLIWNGIR